MKGGFFAGVALGALMGAMALELNPKAKKLAEKGQQALEKQFGRFSLPLFFIRRFSVCLVYGILIIR